jgi:hypothetical protein
VSRADAPVWAVSRSVRSWVFSARRAVICWVRRLPMSSFQWSGSEDDPTASARKIETMETRW